MRSASRIVFTTIRYLRQQKLRTGLSILGVVCGVVAVFSMSCIGEGAKREALRQIRQLGVRNIIVRAKAMTQSQKARAIGGLSRGLQYDDAVSIRNVLKSAAAVSALLEVKASVVGMKKEFTPHIAAVTSSYRDTQNIHLAQGRFLTPQDGRRKNLVAVLGHNVAERLGEEGKPGRRIRIEDVPFKIVGILGLRHWEKSKTSVVSPRDYNQMIFIPLGTERILAGDIPKRFAPDVDSVSELVVTIDRAGHVLQSADIIQRILMVAHRGVEDFSIIVPQELFKKMKETQRTFNFVLGSIASVSLIVGGIGIMNIMLATISERRQEIGIRRAVGATQQHILFQFLVEAVILTTIGGVLGLLVGFAFVGLLHIISGWEIAIVPWALVLSLFMATTVGVISGLYPAVLAARTDPIEALRT